MFTFWRKKNIENEAELQNLLARLKERTHADVLAFIGIDGSVTGLNLVKIHDEGFDERLFAGKIASLYHAASEMSHAFQWEPSVVTCLQNSGKTIYLIFVTASVVFAGIIPQKTNIEQIVEWLSKNKGMLNSMFAT